MTPKKKYVIGIRENGKRRYISDYTIRKFDKKALPDYVESIDEAIRFDTLREVNELVGIILNPFNREFFPEKVSGEQIKKAVASGENHLV